MIKKILIGLGIVIALALIIIFAFFYKSDLSKEDLTDTYINEKSKFMELPSGANMHYRDEGNPNGPVLVMVHGGFGSLQNWEGWIEPLKNEYRLISMDLLGHGLTGAYPANIYDRHTERDAVHQLLQKLNIKKYTVAGNSFGGGIALEMGLEFPNEVEGLILVDSEGVPNGDDGYDTSRFNSDDPMTPEDPNFEKLSFLENLGSKFIGPSLIKVQLESMIVNKDMITDDFIDYYGRILRYKGNRKAQLLMFRQGMYLISKNPKTDLLPRLKELKMPVLVMQGEQDDLVPMRVAHKFNDNIAISELAVVPESGHMPMIEKPEETAEMVDAFFKKYAIGSAKKTYQLIVGSKPTTCEGVGIQSCLFVKKQGDNVWELQYDAIEGFNYEEGYEFVLEVREEKIANPAADGSDIKLVLIRETSKERKESEGLPN